MAGGESLACCLAPTHRARLGGMGRQRPKVETTQGSSVTPSGTIQNPTYPSKGSTQQPQQVYTNTSSRGASSSKSAQPGDKACINFNKGICATDHPSQFHICSCRLYTMHAETEPPHRTILLQEVSPPKWGGGGGGV